MELATGISSLALVIAFAAAVYTRRSWVESQRANDIALHEKQLSIYKSFNSLKFSMLQKAGSITHEETGRFYTPSRDSEFYFKLDTHNRIIKYFDVCFDLAELNRHTLTRKYTEKELDEVYKKQDILLEQEARLSNEIDSELKKACIITNKGLGIVMPNKWVKGDTHSKRQVPCWGCCRLVPTSKATSR